MHVISCAESESIQIGDGLTIKVLEIHDDHVRIGITSYDGAPDSCDDEPSYWEETLYLETSGAELLLN